jgi:hypothetical protein
MFLMFGKSMNPVFRLIVGVAILVVGIVAHLVLAEVIGGAYLAFAAFMLVRSGRGTR